MKVFEENMGMAIQGDVCFTRVDDIDPSNLVAMKPEEGYMVVAHSETGHNHAFEDDGVEVMDDPKNDFVSWLKVNKTVDLKHFRGYDPHETIRFTPGTYRINRQREFTPEGFRRVAD